MWVLSKMKFKMGVQKTTVSRESYAGKPCTLTPYARLKIWKARNPERWKEILRTYYLKSKASHTKEEG